MLEKRDKPGGRAYVFEQDGFTFDAGPTIITAPWLIRDLFASAGKRMEDYVTLVPIEPFYNICLEDDSIFHYNADRDQLLEQIRAFNPADAEGYLRFRDRTDDILRIGMALIDRPFTHVSDMLAVAPDLIRLQSYKSVAAFVNQYIQDERLRRSLASTPC